MLIALSVVLSTFVLALAVARALAFCAMTPVIEQKRESWK